MNGWELLRGIAPVSLCDWPGHVCSVLFFGGCNLRCPTCHNRTIAWRPQTLPILSRRYVLDELLSRQAWLDGITITGGEASIVPGITAVLREFNNLGLPVKLDTNGMRPDLVATFLQQDLVKCFAVDVKGPWDKYPELTGTKKITPKVAREHLEAIFDMAGQHPDRFYFRCTQVPGLTEEDIVTVRSYLPPGFSLTLQTYIEPSQGELTSDGTVILQDNLKDKDVLSPYNHA